MNSSLRQTTFRYLLVVLPGLILCLPNNSKAQVQVTVRQDDCSQSDGPCAVPLPRPGDNAPSLDIEGIPPVGPGQVAIVSAAGAMFGLKDAAAAVKNEPYQAQAVTEMKQTLADGSHIVQTTTATVARDSDGRTVRIQKLRTMGPWRSTDDSQGNSQTLTTIFDPVAKEHIDYTSDSKVAHVLPMPPFPLGMPPGAVVSTEEGLSVSAAVPAPIGGSQSGFTVSGPDPGGVAVQRFAAVSPQPGKGIQPKTESLGSKTVEGIEVTGTRSTSTIPAGTIGNDKDLIITRETWYSPELKLVVRSTQNDPRFGQTTYSLKNIEQGQPDEALFQVPADYKIDKITPRFVKADAQ